MRWFAVYHISNVRADSQRAKAKKIKEQVKKIKTKNLNIEENFRFRSNKDQRKKSFSPVFGVNV